MQENESIGFEKFELIEVKSDSDEYDKDYFLNGFIVPSNKDSVNDVVTEEAQDDILVQLEDKNITMDLDHESFRKKDGSLPDRELNKIPVAKIISSEKINGDAFAKTKLNNDHPLFKNILRSIKNNYLYAFSVAYVVKDAVIKTINNEKVRFIKKLELRNVGITGNPVNTNATFCVSLKSHLLKMEEKQITQIMESFAELKSSVATLNTSTESFFEKHAAVEAQKVEAKSLNEKEAAHKAELKSLNEKLEANVTEIAELKSKLNAPVNKAQVQGEVSAVKTEVKSKGFESFIY